MKTITTLIFLFIFCHQFSEAQIITKDISKINIDALSDSEIKQLITQAGPSSSTNEILRFAASNGLPVIEVKKLGIRIESLSTGNNDNNTDSVISKRKVILQSDSITLKNQDKVSRRIFGSDLFNGGNLTFEPNLRLATPKNYILGPDDQININISGRSVVNWKLSVSPDGNITIPAIGVVKVAGQSIEAASANIQNRLNANNYNIGNGSNLNITLGDIRSIKVLLVGEIVKPGTYTLPSLATVFNALYASGGPNTNGSFRKIEIIRNNKIIRHLDVYDFLLKGSQSDNIGLKDQDIIRVPTYNVKVDLSGEVKRPAIFEVLQGETLSDVLKFAGGFTDQAYTDNIKVEQIIGQEKQLIDVLEADYDNYVPLRGDKFIIDGILDRYKNRVTINGAVFRPGVYAISKDLTLSNLIKKASGLKEGAFSSRGFITRLKPDNSLELISFKTLEVVNGTASDIALQREDVITIPAITDLRDEYYVSINGQVRKPGQFSYADSMTVEDLIILAGGFSEDASTKRIAVARRINNSDPTVTNSEVAKISTVSSTESLDINDQNFVLKPFDIISIYPLPGFEKQKLVKVEGEVLYPGTYVIKNNSERISEILNRAGGLTASADASGGTLERLKLNSDNVNLKNQLNGSSDTANNSQNNQNEFVGIDLEQIIRKPTKLNNITIEEGDILRIPKEQNVVHVNGEVLRQSAVVYNPSKSLKNYVLNAGGFTPNAINRKAYVVYPNGAIEGTRNFLFFHFYPRVKPGSTVFVPTKRERKGLNTAEVVGIGGTLVSVAAIILSVLK